VACLTGVTVRTLHHYDEVGLLSSSGRSAAGYRIYDESDLERLQGILILFYRELGFSVLDLGSVLPGIIATLPARTTNTPGPRWLFYQTVSKRCSANFGVDKPPKGVGMGVGAPHNTVLPYGNGCGE